MMNVDSPQCDFCGNDAEDGCHACDVRWCLGCRYVHECPEEMDDYCVECLIPEHDICPLNAGCPCCDDTIEQMEHVT